jgi:flagellar hook-associated protein 1 FlgK
MSDGTESMLEFLRRVVTRVGVEAQTASEMENGSRLTVESLRTRQEETSGVSLDEEAVNMMRYQRAFEAAARLISVVDEMLTTVISLGGR